MRKHTRQNKYICKDYTHVDIYPVITYAKSRRKERYKPTSETQRIINQRTAEKYLERLIEANYDNNDYFVTLSYAVEPLTDEEAEANAYNYIRRLEYKCNKLGLDKPCVIWCTEQGKRTNRYHHHLILKCALNRDLIEDIWRDKKHPTHGYINADRLQFDERGLTPLANYLQKTPISKQRWRRTRNLKEPKKQSNDNMTQRQFKVLLDEHANNEVFERAYPGYTLAGQPKRIYNEVNGFYYLSFKLYKKDSDYIRPTVTQTKPYTQHKPQTQNGTRLRI